MRSGQAYLVIQPACHWTAVDGVDDAMEAEEPHLLKKAIVSIVPDEDDEEGKRTYFQYSVFPPTSTA